MDRGAHVQLCMRTHVPFPVILNGKVSRFLRPLARAIQVQVSLLSYAERLLADCGYLRKFKLLWTLLKK